MLYILFALSQVVAIKGNLFDVLTYSDAGAIALKNSLISNVKRNSKFMCLSECKKRSDCLTVIHNTIDFNCFLLKDQLGSSDIVASTSSNLYFKKSSKKNNR